MKLPLKLILVLGAICDPRYNWTHRDTFMREWRNAGGKRV